MLCSQVIPLTFTDHTNFLANIVKAFYSMYCKIITLYDKFYRKLYHYRAQALDGNLLEVQSVFCILYRSAWGRLVANLYVIPCVSNLLIRNFSRLSTAFNGFGRFGAWGGRRLNLSYRSCIIYFQMHSRIGS